MTKLKTDIFVHNDKWEVHIVPHKYFLQNFHEDLQGITLIQKKEIYLSKQHLSFDLIKHELFHVFKSYLCLDRSTIDPDNLEEIYAEFFSLFSEKLYIVCVELYKDCLTLLHKQYKHKTNKYNIKLKSFNNFIKDFINILKES